MGQKQLKRGANLDGVYYPPGSKVDDEVFTNPKLYEDPEVAVSYDEDGQVEVEEPETSAPAKKTAAKKTASSSS